MKKPHVVCPGWAKEIHHPRATDKRKQYTKILEWGDSGAGATHGMCEPCKGKFLKKIK